MKWIIAFWIIGVMPEGQLSTSEYQMVMYEPAFEKESDCILYSLQSFDLYLRELQEQIEVNTEYSGFKLISEPECKLFNEDTMELIEGGSDI